MYDWDVYSLVVAATTKRMIESLKTDLNEVVHEVDNSLHHSDTEDGRFHEVYEKLKDVEESLDEVYSILKGLTKDLMMDMSNRAMSQDEAGLAIKRAASVLSEEDGMLTLFFGDGRRADAHMDSPGLWTIEFMKDGKKEYTLAEDEYLYMAIEECLGSDIARVCVEQKALCGGTRGMSVLRTIYDRGDPHCV